MDKTFKDLLEELHNTKPQPNPKYWQTILDNSKLIMREINFRNQGVVARDLKLPLPKLSAVVSILRELAYAAE